MRLILSFSVYSLTSIARDVGSLRVVLSPRSSDPPRRHRIHCLLSTLLSLSLIGGGLIFLFSSFFSIFLYSSPLYIQWRFMA